MLSLTRSHRNELIDTGTAQRVIHIRVFKMETILSASKTQYAYKRQAGVHSLFISRFRKYPALGLPVTAKRNLKQEHLTGVTSGRFHLEGGNNNPPTCF